MPNGVDHNAVPSPGANTAGSPNPGNRCIFSYVVAFADKRRLRRTEGATFVIHIAPFPGIDGRNTVFGRVIEGKDTVRKLEYYDVIEDAQRRSPTRAPARMSRCRSYRSAPWPRP